MPDHLHRLLKCSTQMRRPNSHFSTSASCFFYNQVGWAFKRSAHKEPFIALILILSIDKLWLTSLLFSHKEEFPLSSPQPLSTPPTSNQQSRFCPPPSLVSEHTSIPLAAHRFSPCHWNLGLSRTSKFPNYAFPISPVSGDYEVGKGFSEIV